MARLEAARGDRRACGLAALDRHRKPHRDAGADLPARPERHVRRARAQSPHERRRSAVDPPDPARQPRELWRSVRGRAHAHRRLQGLAHRPQGPGRAAARHYRGEPSDPQRGAARRAFPESREPGERAPVRDRGRHGGTRLRAPASGYGGAPQDARRDPQLHADGVRAAAARARARRARPWGRAGIPRPGVAVAHHPGTPRGHGAPGPEPHAARHRLRDGDRGAGRFRPAAAAAAGTCAGAARAEARPRPAAAGGAAGLRPRGERGAAAHLLGGARCEALRVFHRRARRLRPGSHARGPRARGARRAAARPGRSRVALWRRELEPAARRERGAAGGLRHRHHGAAAAVDPARRSERRLAAHPAAESSELLLHQHPARGARGLRALPRGAGRPHHARAADDPRTTDRHQRSPRRGAAPGAWRRGGLRHPRAEPHLDVRARARQPHHRRPLVDRGGLREAPGVARHRIPGSARRRGRGSADLRHRGRAARGEGGEHSQGEVGHLSAELLHRVRPRGAGGCRRHLPDERVFRARGGPLACAARAPLPERVDLRHRRAPRTGALGARQGGARGRERVHVHAVRRAHGAPGRGAVESRRASL